MADNVEITSGTGTFVSTDDAGADGQVQRIKLAYSANGVATHVQADADGLLVNLGANNDVTLAASTNNIGDVDVLTLPALPAGTNNIGDVDVLTLPALPAGTNNIGDVDVLTVPADPFGVNADAGSATGSISAKLRFIAATGIPITALPALAAGTNGIGRLTANSGVDIGDVDVTSLTGGTIAHDSPDSGNPIKVGGRAQAAAASVTLVAVADRTDLTTDLDSALITRVGCPLGDIISDTNTNTDGAADAFTGSFAATANLRNYITCVSIANTSATAVTVDLRDGTGGAVLFTFMVPAGGGIVVPFSPPLRQPTVNTALALDGSAAASTITVSVNGFKSKA